MKPNAWDRLARSRGGEPLRPERLRSLLVVVPAASGDVALATTLVRYVKRAKPDCRVSFATRKANVPLAETCPGIDEVIVMPAPGALDGHGWDAVSRQQYLKEYAGGAEAVVCTCFFPEDTDLLTEHGLNALEAIWLLAGVRGEMPPSLPRVWLEPPPSVGASAVIRRALGRQARRHLIARGMKRLPESLGAAARARSLQGSGVRLVARDLSSFSRNVIELSSPIHRQRLMKKQIGYDFVLLSTEAVSVTPPNRGVTESLVRLLREAGRTVLHNVRDPIRAAPGTVPLVCSYAEFLSLRQSGVPFVGWRSGLCDIAAASPAPMAVLYPPEHDWCKDQLATFGLNGMGVADCLEFVCRDAADVSKSKIVDYLQQRDF